MSLLRCNSINVGFVIFRLWNLLTVKTVDAVILKIFEDVQECEKRICIEALLFHFNCDVEGSHCADIEVVFHTNLAEEITTKYDIVIT
jgi:hypothetical protein